MIFDLLTIFPDYFKSPFSQTILSKGLEKGLFNVRMHDIRDFADAPHYKVDDEGYGGGPGMVMQPQPIYRSLEKLNATTPQPHVRRIYLSPQGRPLQQSFLSEYLNYEQIILLCGRYEGVDERVIENYFDEEVSIGDYILTGGEPAALVFIDAVSRLIPGVVGKEASIRHDSFSPAPQGPALLEYPHYTRPANFMGHTVPEILLSGHHERIEQWRREQALARTRKKRPDLLKK